MFLVIEISGMFSDICYSARSQGDESHARVNGHQYMLDLLKVGMHQTILIATEPERFYHVTGVLQQRLYERFKVVFFAAHRCFIHHEQDLHTTPETCTLQDSR